MITNKEKIKQAILLLILLCVCIIIFLPLMWIASTALRPSAEAYRMPPSFIPTVFEWGNFQKVFDRFPFWKFSLNSFLVAGGTVLLNIAVTTLAGFALARIPFKGRGVVMIILMSGMMVPGSVLMVSLFVIMNSLHLINTHWALILPGMISPLYIFLVRQFMATIPMSYEEASVIDGCTRFKFFLMIALPMSKPVVFMAVLRVFIDSWNNFLGPLIYLTDWQKLTLPLGLKMLESTLGTSNTPIVLVGVLLSLIVPTIVYLIGQKSLIEGVAISGLKG